MKNIFYVIAFFTLIACQKVKLVKNLSGESYLCRTLTNDPIAPYNGNGYFDSTIFKFEDNRVIIKYPRARNNDENDIFDTSDYSSKRSKFTFSEIWEVGVKDINGENFTADIKSINSQNIQFTAYFFKIK